jgi:hypothetical protein
VVIAVLSIVREATEQRRRQEVLGVLDELIDQLEIDEVLNARAEHIDNGVPAHVFCQ